MRQFRHVCVLAAVGFIATFVGCGPQQQQELSAITEQFVNSVGNDTEASQQAGDSVAVQRAKFLASVFSFVQNLPNADVQTILSDLGGNTLDNVEVDALQSFVDKTGATEAEQVEFWQCVPAAVEGQTVQQRVDVINNSGCLNGANINAAELNAANEFITIVATAFAS